VRDLQGNPRTIGYVVLAGIALLYLVLLSAVGIFDPEEGRHVAIATAMLRSGDLAVTIQWFVLARYMTTDMVLSGRITIARPRRSSACRWR
jgi:4-amino-4-deoxy-L-arabinose transferase-like glycosyltransferase